MILGVLMYGKEQLEAMVSKFFWIALVLGVAGIAIWVAWSILAGIIPGIFEFARISGLVVHAVALSVWLGIVAVASWTWGGKPVFTARRIKIVLGLSRLCR